MTSAAPTELRAIIRWAGLFAGPVLAGVCYWLLPGEYEDATGTVVPFTAAGRATLAVMLWMALWWLTEAIDLAATALLPLVLFPLLGVVEMKTAAAPYAHELIFLFMGGFLLAGSMQKWGLGRRAALMTLRLVGTKPVNMVGGFMLVTAVFSAFVSNTATTAMMLPIAISVIQLVRPSADEPSAGGRDNFALCLMLGIAYAASIGGIATIIGTPPNGFLVGFLKNDIATKYQMDIGFAQWLKIGVPLVVVFLPIAWFMLTRVIYPIRIREIEGGRELIRAQLRELGPADRGQWITAIVFACAALCWITRPLLKDMSIVNVQPFTGLTDAGIAITAGLILFVIPVNMKRHEFVMDWHTAVKLPWGLLILFGGGLSLAGAVKDNGVAEFFASFTTHVAAMPDVVIVLVVAAAVIFLTELTSNTATSATLVPILAALGPGLGVHPYLLIFPAAIAASCAFMLPVATPPNAIVFGSGHVSIPQMCKAGLWLNLIGIVLVTLLTMYLLQPALRFDGL